ncbi:MAG: hypothetical protein WHS63_12605 [Tenuifilum sp.]|uniref:hypothetical protein n=1 Tax=Tenuifilum sp. TaxID=2760880 RepID=UPI0030B1AA06
MEQLNRYPAEFACLLLEQALAGGYKTVVFASTPDDFRRWNEQRGRKTVAVDKTKLNETWNVPTAPKP